MTPNLFLATQTLFSPHKWFKSQKSERLVRETAHWDSPIPGIYEYIPGRGWYLIATDKNVGSDARTNQNQSSSSTTCTIKDSNGTSWETIKMTTPVQVKYSKVLKRYLLAPDYEMRKSHGKITDPVTGKSHIAGFFRLDDGIAWVECWDEDGEFIPGPYKLWCIDKATGQFRHMLKGDDPSYIPSRHNSFEGESVDRRRRRSQDSRSTHYRGSGPGSTRDGPSVPSTRPNSVKALTPGSTSRPGSQVNSRRNSPKRSPMSPTIPHLDEAKERLRKMAAEQREASASRSRANSAESANGERRGRLAS